MRGKFAALIGLALMFGALVVAGAQASVPRVIMAEEFGYTT